MPDKSQLIESIRARKSRRGIVTADRYFKDVQVCFEGGFCPSVAGVADEAAWKRAIKEAESKLTYTNAETEILKSSIASSNEGIMEFDAIITTPLRDRDRDMLLTKGANPDPHMSLLMYHIPVETVGAYRGKKRHTEHELRGGFVIADTAMGHDASKLIKVGALRISHGFDPKKWEEMEDGEGWLFKEFDIFEVSLVSIPSNTDAVITQFNEKDFETDFVKAMQHKAWKAQGKIMVPVGAIDGDVSESQWDDFVEAKYPSVELVEQGAKEVSCECKRKKELEAEYKKDFDVERQHVEAAKLEYDWISRYCSCEVKQLVNFGTFCPKIKMGSFLTGMRVALSETKEVDVRRLTRDGLESPPEYEVIQLNSKSSDHFLTKGISFRKTESGVCFAIKFEREYWPPGESVEVFCAKKDESHVGNYLSKAWQWTDQNNFLKGEAFSIDGDFISESGYEWGDLFLQSENEAEVKRSVELMNSKGKECPPNRGQVFMGPPGTGKTLSGRLIKDNVDATFIWVGGKQAYYYGGVNAVSIAFDLAKELAPAVIFMEDIDASLRSDYATDFLKTEMDGIGKSSGILTILTTNHPKSFPEALLDRPGRFHDVLKFDLPTDDIRTKMIEKWLPGISDKAKVKAIEDTDGYSGAHVYELCQYAKNLSDQDEIGIDDALTKAIKKIHDQRQLIDEELCRDRTMATRRRSIQSRLEKSGKVTKSYGFDEKRIKAGSRLSQATQSEISDAISDLDAISGMSDVPRPVMTLVNSAMGCLMGLVGTDDEKSFEDIEKTYFAELVKCDVDGLVRQHQRLSLILNAAEDQKAASEKQQSDREWDELLSQV